MNIGLNSGIKEYPEIDILHIIGAAMILLCHFTQKEHLSALGELFISGVPLFLFVSGFLVGCRELPSSPKRWIRKKAIRVLIPFYIWVFPAMLVLWLTNHEMVSVTQFIFLSLNLQGLNYLIWPSNLYSAVIGLGQLWFVTEIMACYLLVLVFCRFIEKENSKKRWMFLMTVTVCLLQPLLVACGVQISYLVTFFIGLLTGRLGIKITNRLFVYITVLCIIITGLRFILKDLIDGANYYDRYYALISSAALGIWVFFFVFWVSSRKNSLIKKISENKAVVFLSGITYEIYITHFWFLNGFWQVANYIKNPILADCIVVIFTLVSAYILNLISGKAKKMLVGRGRTF